MLIKQFNRSSSTKYCAIGCCYRCYAVHLIIDLNWLIMRIIIEPEKLNLKLIDSIKCLIHL